ncbi:hypothetical protein GGR58DRAFT_529370 [Xylaria digitata]|nr:hypothetical protein GGR58DRAFT_529370 [Xylaria digitata]
MDNVKLEGGSVALTLSDEPQSIFEILQGQGGAFNAKATAKLQIGNIDFVKSIASINMDGESNSKIGILQNNSGSFIATTNGETVLHIGDARLNRSTVTQMIDGDSKATFNSLQGIDTSLSHFTTGGGQVGAGIKNCWVISVGSIEGKAERWQMILLAAVDHGIREIDTTQHTNISDRNTRSPLS